MRVGREEEEEEEPRLDFTRNGSRKPRGVQACVCNETRKFLITVSIPKWVFGKFRHRLPVSRAFPFLERVGFVSGGNGSFQITIVREEFRISNWMEIFNGQV